MKRASILTLTLIASAVFVGLGCETMFVDPSPDPSASDFVVSGKTESFFAAHQIDPRSEDSAGPQLVDAADLDGDGLMDLASVWNQSQPRRVRRTILSDRAHRRHGAHRPGLRPQDRRHGFRRPPGLGRAG